MGSLIYGKERLERELKSNTLQILFLASDCSENTKKLWVNKTTPTGTILIQFQKITKKELANRLGKKELSAVSTRNIDLINGIRKYLEYD